MNTCVIPYDIDPNCREIFEQYARNWGECIPRCGADLIGYFALHEGFTSTAYSIYSLPSLASYETYRAQLAADPLGQKNYQSPGAKVSFDEKAACSSRWLRHHTGGIHDCRHLRSVGSW